MIRRTNRAAPGGLALFGAAILATTACAPTFSDMQSA